VFAAKQAEAVPATALPGMNKAVIAIVVGALLLMAAGGAYVWYEINRKPAPIARAPQPVSSPKPVTPAPPTAPVAADPAQIPDKAVDTISATAPPAASLKQQSPVATPSRRKAQPKAEEKLVTSLLKDSASTDKGAPPLKLSRTTDAPRISPEVSQGYDALKRGDAAEARKQYESAVAADPANLDGHLGLATAAARGGDRATAIRHYRRALALDPKNPAALAGIAALSDFSRPDGLESQLRANITQYPNSPALHFTLGNIYASQSRWTEAQAAYFEAYRLDPESADVAYNLAVSLDHLGRAKLAADFYQRALSAARQQDAQFDKGQVSRRIAELKP
jgi:tetratricopeptide (TPR) repeat protein